VQKIGLAHEAELKTPAGGRDRIYEESGEKAMAFVRAHPRWFAAVTVRRIVFILDSLLSFNPSYLAQEPDDPANIAFSTVFTLLTWLPSSVFQENRSVAFLCACVLVFPIVYYVSHVEVYYRRQMIPDGSTLRLWAVVEPRMEGQTPVLASSGVP